ncbi:MAG: hypothetical protein R6X35_05195 [Candidatus Krumholzibacteriia bacterium]
MNRATLTATCALLVAGILVLAVPVRAGGDARALGMGGTCTAAARGLDAADANPAFLAFSRGVTVGLAGGTIDLQNNAFTLGRYNQVAGATLSEADKAELLADIPAEGFGLDLQADAGALGLQSGAFALTTGAVGAGDGTLDRDFFDLVLFGNEPGRTVDFSGTGGEAYGLVRAGLSWGWRLGEVGGGELAVGATGSVIRGLYHVQVVEAWGAVTTTMSAIDGEAFAAAVVAEGGAGYGLDLGLAWQGGRLALGAALDNAISRIDWNGTVERTEYRVGLSASASDLDDALADSDTTYAVAGYATGLPRRLRLGGAMDLGALTLAADWVQGLEERAGTSTEPMVRVGAEWRPFGLLTPRLGAALGGGLDPGLAAGLGLKAGFWCLDVAALQRGGLGADRGKGLGVGASTRFVF